MLRKRMAAGDTRKMNGGVLDEQRPGGETETERPRQESLGGKAASSWVFVGKALFVLQTHCKRRPLQTSIRSTRF